MPEQKDALSDPLDSSKEASDCQEREKFEESSSDSEDEITQKVANQIEEIIRKGPQKDDIHKLAARVVRTTEVYAGVIPHPRHLKEYNEIVPGSADRLIMMAEREQEAQIDTTKANISIAINAQNSEMSLRRLGMRYGFASLLVLLGSAVYSAEFISIPFGMTILGLGVSGIVGKFFYDKYNSKE